MTKRAILYARVSGDDRRNATSGIDSQLADCRAYAQAKGYKVVSEFFEEPNKATSGADWLPELEKALSLAHAGGYDVLVVREVDRLARNRFKQMAVEVDLERAGVLVEYVKGQYEDTPEGRLLKGLVSEFAEYEREKINQRTKRGMVNSVKAGNVKFGGTSAPYGYDVGIVGGRRTLVVNEQEAAVIHTIFDLYATYGYSLQGIADYLNEHNISKPLKGAAHRHNDKGVGMGWAIGTISNMLKSETYIGRWHYGKSRKGKHPETGKSQYTVRPKSEWLLVEVPAIIDQHTYNIVQDRRARNKRELSARATKGFYSMGGMVTCGACGYAMSGFRKKGSNGTIIANYRCNVRAQKKRFAVPCNAPYFRADKVETVVWEWVKTFLLNPQKLGEAFQTHQNQMAERNAPTLRMIEASRAKVAQLEGEKGRLKRAYRAGVIELEEFARDREVIDKELAILSGAVAQLENELNHSRLSADDMANIRAYAENVGKAIGIADKSPEMQRGLFRTLRLSAVLGVEEGGKYVDVRCVLGENRAYMDSQTTSIGTPSPSMAPFPRQSFML